MTSQVEQDRRELAKLRKINKVLMDRVEREMDAQSGTAFSLFQTAITLESRVSERTTELTRLTQRLLSEISERREAEKALLLATAEAEQANISKTRFLAAASHDLNQPLNAARLFLSALEDEVGAGRPRELVDRVTAALGVVSEMLDTLLEISKLDAGAWPVQPSSFPIAPLLARMASEYGPQAAACGIELRHVACVAALHTDRAMLERILRNLISNAIRYTVTGRILIGCRRGAGMLRIEVWDTGIGIPAYQIGDIFQEFRQLGNNPRRDKGIGLGLAIVDRIARVLDLPLSVKSRLGFGSCFAVSVPLGEPLAPAVSALSGIAGRTIVVVEPDQAALGPITALLRSWGCVVMSATTCKAALDLSGRPDLIIADHAAPTCQVAPEAVRALQNRFGPVPALILSNDRSDSMKAQMRALGGEMLPKPAAPAKLRSMLSYLLRQQAITAAL